MKMIKVKNISSLCLGEQDGMKLRQEIEDGLQARETVCIDFEEIKMFATPFFNISVGYYIGKLGIEQYEKCIKVINLSIFGESVYKRVYDNAVSYYESSVQKKIDVIVSEIK